MRGRDALHFDLVITIAWIHIIEMLFAGRPRINHRGAVQRFGDALDRVLFRNPKPQVVQSSPFPAAVDSCLTRGLNGHANQRAEVETVADAPALIVDSGMADGVGIDPAGGAI